MVRSCSAFGCSNKWEIDCEIKFYRIPKDKDLRQQWITNIKREGKLPKDENFFICSSHFEESCFQQDFQVSFLYYLKTYNIDRIF